jgi:serine/threonine protein kinase
MVIIVYEMGSCASIQKSSNIKISDFTPLSILGKGRYGTVYKAIHIPTGHQVAIKEISKLFFEISEQNELEILSTLNDNFIINLIFAFQSEKYAYLCLDYMPGITLRKYMEMKPDISSSELQFITACIVRGLEYLNSQNVIHHDLKPENLLFDSQGYLLLTDFGLSQKIKKLKKSNSGTLAYIAPEVLFGQNYSGISDVYSLGVILFEIIEGRRPYVVTSRKQLLQNYVNFKFEMKRKQFGEIVLDFVKKCLVKNKFRLGAKDFQEIKKHRWFREFDWNKLSEKRIDSPCCGFEINEAESVDHFGVSNVFEYRSKQIPKFFYCRMVD